MRLEIAGSGEIMVHLGAKEFRIYPKDSVGSLKNFKQRSSTIIF